MAAASSDLEGLCADTMGADLNVSTDELARVLCQYPVGLSSRRIGAILNRSPRIVIERLIELQRAGHVSLKQGCLWQWTGMRPSVAGNPSMPANAAGLTARRRLPDPRQGIPQQTRWSAFRRLCLYYAECVRLEDRASVSEYAEKENRRFLAIGQGLDWTAVSAGAPVALTVPTQWSEFVRHIGGRRSSPRLFIGAPLDVMVFHSDSGEFRIVSPVFVIQVEHKIEDGRLFLQPVSSVEVNHGWLEKRFKNLDDRRVFMELVGLENPEPEGEGNHRPAAMSSLPQVVEALYRGYREWWKEFPDLARPASTPPLQQVAQRGFSCNGLLSRLPGSQRYTSVQSSS